MSSLLIITAREEPRADTRDLAKQLGVKHQNLFELVKSYATDFEQLGKVLFQTGASLGSRTGQSVKFALLTEDQCYLLLTFCRNSEKVRALKVELIKAFRDARASAAVCQYEYLPGYHHLHDLVHQLAADSENRHWVHANFDKLLNKAVGLSSGQRASMSTKRVSLMVLAQAAAIKATASAKDHREGYQRAKDALSRLQEAFVMLDSPDVAGWEPKNAGT